MLAIDDDAFIEDTEELVIAMAFKAPTGAGHYMGELDKTTLNILDDDAPGMSILYDVCCVRVGRYFIILCCVEAKLFFVFPSSRLSSNCSIFVSSLGC